VAGDQRTADLLQGESRTGYRSDIVEAAGTVVLQEKIPLFVCGAVAELADVIDDVSVRNGQVEVPIIVVVQVRDAKADEWQSGLAHAAFKRHVGEQSFSEIPE